jgi:catechol 2,3-dioxygenase-like lactoylglutathione lyase family enzyme
MSHEYQASRDVIIRTPHFEEAKTFYETVLKLKVAYESDTLLGYETGAFKLYVEKGEPLGVVFEFRVPDTAQAIAALQAGGCEIVETDPKVPRIYVRDPFGLMFNIGPA